jgi:hypothetical protein
VFRCFVTEFFGVDDSRSMQREEGGKRIEALRKTLNLVAKVFMLARPKKSQGTEQGINAVRFLNFAKGWTNVVPKATDTIIKQHTFRHWSRIGTELKAKVLDKHVFGKSMKKPLLVITITDGDVKHLILRPFFVYLLIIPRSKARQRTSWFPSLTIALNSSKNYMETMVLMVGLSLAYSVCSSLMKKPSDSNSPRLGMMLEPVDY